MSAEPATFKGRRFGNIVLAGSDAPLPLAAYAERAARGAYPYRVLHGARLIQLIGGQSGVEPWLLVQGGRATTTKTRFVAQGQQLLRADHENPEPIQARLADRLLRIAQDTIAATRVMVLSDYRKGVLSGDIPQRLIAASKAAGRKVVVDPKGLDYSVYAGADLVTPNRNELRLATGRSIESEGALVDAARSLRLFMQEVAPRFLPAPQALATPQALAAE